eukprot:1343226-Amorphochlora_amoeboformis.AAC.1
MKGPGNMKLQTVEEELEEWDVITFKSLKKISRHLQESRKTLLKSLEISGDLSRFRESFSERLVREYF